MYGGRVEYCNISSPNDKFDPAIGPEPLNKFFILVEGFIDTIVVPVVA